MKFSFIIWQYLTHKAFLWILLVVNVLGTIGGYIWYGSQLADTKPIFRIFVPDSPTATLFFSIAIIFWLFGKHFRLIEALALITLVKYGLWAVVMNLLALQHLGSIGYDGWMLVISHFAMAVQGVLYIPKYKFRLIHVAIAGAWTLHDVIIDYVFGQMPIYSMLSDYIAQIGYFTFWLSILCIALAYWSMKKRFLFDSKIDNH